eukprot:PLAT5385.3.p1 GENE.PLAT5385.3~~PLAT5385.3.p1  ORF type:complete len:452 (-),score=120.97 PLAT5385.3:114-1469(-)
MIRLSDGERLGYASAFLLQITRLPWEDDGIDEGGKDGWVEEGKAGGIDADDVLLDVKSTPQRPFWRLGDGLSAELGNSNGSSLLALHGPKASRRRGRQVHFGDSVTLFGNVESGRYLSPSGRPRLAWKSTKQGVMKESSGESEWIVRRVDAEDPNLLDDSSAGVLYGDAIALESRFHAGWFVRASEDDQLLLSRGSFSSFTIVAPSLKFAIALGTWMQGKDRMQRLPAPPRPVPLREEELGLRDYLSALPSELVLHIFSFHRNWSQRCRLVCKDWMFAVDDTVKRIRIGEFADVRSRARRLEVLSFASRCRSLRSFKVRNMDRLSDEELCDFRIPPYLHTLSLGGCSGLGDAAIEHIVTARSLKHVNLARSAISDDGAHLLARGLPLLENVNLYGCESLTDDGIMAFTACSKLRQMNLRGTPVSKEAIEEFRAEMPGVTVLTGAALPDGIY